MNKILLAFLTSAIPAISAFPAVADNSSPPPPPPLPPHAPLLPVPPPPNKTERLKHILLVRDLLIRKYDTNGDGKLDSTEKETLLRDAEEAKKNARKAFLKKHDKDGDGKLSPDEWTAIHKKRKDRGKRVSNNPSANAGVPPRPISPPAPGEPPLPPPPPKIILENEKHEKFIVRPTVFMLAHTLLLKQYDTNGNNRIDPDEFEKIRKDADHIHEEKLRILLSKYDKNGDGALSSEEKEGISLSKKDNTSASEQDEAMDDIDLFIQESFDEELLESMEELDPSTDE